MMQVHKYRKDEETGNVVITIRDKEMVFNCTYEQYRNGIIAYQAGKVMQDAFPFLSADEREFLMSGFTPFEWREIFGDEEG